MLLWIQLLSCLQNNKVILDHAPWPLATATSQYIYWTSDKNIYFLDEYSRFPFVFHCPDITARTVIKCLTLLFTVFGMPTFVHSDHGTSLVSQEVRAVLSEKGVAMSHTTQLPTILLVTARWRSTKEPVTMACKSKNLPIKYWQEVLPDVLHSIWSLLCTSTNETPHERLFCFA